ncbi:hypothetical protein ACFLT1_06465 [Bacteroidota bacterium]
MKKGILILKVLLVLLIAFNLSGLYGQVYPEIDTTNFSKKIPKNNTIEIIVKKTQVEKSIKSSFELDNSVSDVDPNPRSPEGIQLEKKRTDSKIIKGEAELQLQIEEAGSKFLNSISDNDEVEFNNIFRYSKISFSEETEFITKRKKMYQFLISNLRDTNSNVNDFGFAITNVNDEGDVVHGIMVNSEKIQTAEMIFEKIKDGWIIISIVF